MSSESRTTLTRRLFLAMSGAVASSLASLKALAQGETQDVPHTGFNESEPVDRKNIYSPYADLAYPSRVFWGETHLHTSYSPDAGLVGDHLDPDDAFRFARGDEIKSSTGQLVRLERPYDWLLVSDHSEYLGLPQALASGDPLVMNTPQGKKTAEALKQGGQAAYDAFARLTLDFANGKPTLLSLDAANKLLAKTWQLSIAAAERANKPGTFTAFIGYEWTSSPGGNNLHRNVVFRDGANRTKQIVPFSSFDSTDPMDLWRFLADYEQKTGGRVLTVAHNPNLSCGLMFDTKNQDGKPFTFTPEYAQMRSRFDRLVEATQGKGDSETTPQISPEDPFADFERWNKANIFGMVATTPEMLPFNYARSAIKLGQQHEAKIGVNPFKLGFIGASDQHSSMCTTRNENYFGVGGLDEPKPGRWKELFMKSRVSSKLDVYMWEFLPGGMTGVWARENTRESIWDALHRREVYATTGTRPVIRVFGGWDFSGGDLGQPNYVWVRQGYARGVPMGGDLTKAPQGKAPTLIFEALADPAGAFLDRVQIIKGWLDSSGAMHEKVVDVAWSGDRKPDPTTGEVPLVGTTVDIKGATWTNSIGAPALKGFWRDPDFDPGVHSFYYVRLIEIPTPRWTAYDAKRFGIEMPSYVTMTVTNRAYTSPIWYTPG